MEEKVYTPTVENDTPFPEQTTENIVTDSSTGGSGGTFSPETTKQVRLPKKIIAHETISSSLNTKSKKILAAFEFTEQGSIQVGKYENGVSGDIRISPNGIVARNQSGITTFALDGDTGNAVFAGEIQSGSIVTGLVQVGNNNVVIDGDAARIVIYDENNVPRILIGYDPGGF